MVPGKNIHTQEKPKSMLTPTTKDIELEKIVGENRNVPAAWGNQSSWLSLDWGEGLGLWESLHLGSPLVIKKVKGQFSDLEKNRNVGLSEWGGEHWQALPMSSARNNSEGLWGWFINCASPDCHSNTCESQFHSLGLLREDNNNSWYLLIVHHVPGTCYSTFHKQSLLILEGECL